MTYQSVLPQIFPHCVIVPEEKVAEYIVDLLAPNSRFPNGSSFAVTVDTDDKYRKVWLSRCSAERLGLL